MQDVCMAAVTMLSRTGGTEARTAGSVMIAAEPPRAAPASTTDDTAHLPINVRLSPSTPTLPPSHMLGMACLRPCPLPSTLMATATTNSSLLFHLQTPLHLMEVTVSTVKHLQSQMPPPATLHPPSVCRGATRQPSSWHPSAWTTTQPRALCPPLAVSSTHQAMARKPDTCGCPPSHRTS